MINTFNNILGILSKTLFVLLKSFIYRDIWYSSANKVIFQVPAEKELSSLSEACRVQKDMTLEHGHSDSACSVSLVSIIVGGQQTSFISFPPLGVPFPFPSLCCQIS